MGIWRWIRNRWALFLCFGIALVAYVVAHNLKLWPEIFGHLSLAFLMAGILGFAVESPLRKELAADVFSAVSGYPLPDDLREEVKNVLRTRLHCIEFTATYSVTHLSDQSVLVTLDMDRLIQNVGGVTEPIVVGAGIEEWFREGGESSVTKFEYQHEGGALKSVDGRERRDAGIQTRKLETKLGPCKTLRVWTSYREIKAKNDEAIIFLGFATKNPKIVAHVPDDIERKVTFAHSERHQVSPHGHTFELRATLMAHQTIVLRWWEKSKNETWNPPKPPRPRKIDQPPE